MGLLSEIYMTANILIHNSQSTAKRYQFPVVSQKLPMSRLCNKLKLYLHSKIDGGNRSERLLMPTQEHSNTNFRRQIPEKTDFPNFFNEDILTTSKLLQKVLGNLVGKQTDQLKVLSIMRLGIFTRQQLLKSKNCQVTTICLLRR